MSDLEELRRLTGAIDRAFTLVPGDADFSLAVSLHEAGYLYRNSV